MSDFIPLPPGFAVGAYRVDELLGAGGFGSVYRARSSDGQQVALKVSHHPAPRQTAQNLVRQQNEIEALMRLSHPALVKVLDFGTLPDQRLFLVMEFVEGESLQDYLRRRGRLDPIEAIRIVRRVAEALAHCHEHGIYHLDLKSSNIMIAEPYEPKVKVLDFGLAQLETAAPRPETVWAGSPVYMAPESFDATRSAPTAKIDLYAVGTVFYEMLTAQLPFDASDNWKLISEKQSKDPIPVAERQPDVPAVVGVLVGELLQRDPARRFGSAQALTARLKELYYHVLHESGAFVPRHDSPSAPIALGDSGQSPFAGRTRELDTLIGHIESTAQGAATALVVVGEAGVGKSRLVAEALRRAPAARMGIIAYGRCRQLGELVPYSPLREALAQLCSTLALMPGKMGKDVRTRIRSAHISDPAVLVGLAPETAELLPRDPVGTTLENVSAVLRLVGAERVARAIVSFLGAIAPVMPVYTVIEDLHWADEGTVAVLARICASHPTARSMLLATSRPSENAEALRVETMALAPLDAADAADLMRRLTGAGDELTQALQRSIPLLAAGSPLVITQVVHNLEAEGYLARIADGQLALGARSLDNYQPPSTVSGVLARTLEQLRPEARAVLSVAALIGRQFFLSDVLDLGLFAAEAVYSAATAAVEHLLCRGDGDKITFAHDTVREHLESTVPRGELSQIHGRIADTLSEREVAAGTLGHHMFCAGRHLPAARCFFAAGQEADDLHDPVGASNALRRAIDVLAQLTVDLAHEDREERDELLARAAFELSRAASALGDTGELLTQLDRCADILGASVLPRQQVALDGAYARLYYVQGNAAKAAEAARRCLATAKDDPALHGFQCLPANILGRALAISGKFTQAVDTLARGIVMAKEQREIAELSQSYGLNAVALSFAGRPQEALAAAEECGQLAAKLEDPLRILGAHLYRSAMSEALYDFTEGVKWSTQLLSYAEEHAINGLYVYVGTVFAGRHQFHLGRLDRARVLLSNALNLATMFNIGMLVSWTHAYLGDVLFVGGRYDDARASYARGLELANAGAGDDYAGPMNLMGLGHTLACTSGGPAGDDWKQRRDGVRGFGDAALERLGRAGNASARVWMLQRYAESLETVGDEAGARQLRDAGAQAARALPVRALDFWPRVPSRAQPMAPREYWREHSSKGSSRRDPSSEGSGSEPAEGPGARSKLYQQLSTVVGYKPPF